jgi:DMSO/TMAO reductase YedYZ heme-binding membrane subunit
MGKSQSNEALLLKGALLPTAVVGVLAIAIATYLEGRAGLFGALLAQVVVLIYFALHILVSKISTNLDPVTTMSLAMFSYFAKFLALGLLLWLLDRFTPETLVDRRSFGIAAVALTFAWLGGEITSYLKLKTHLPLPHEPNA